jgi:hypothetical protein
MYIRLFNFYFNIINTIKYSSFKSSFLKNRLYFFIRKYKTIKEKKVKQKSLKDNILLQKKKYYNYSYKQNYNDFYIYKGSSINIFYSQLFSMMNYFFFFLKKCCFIHFLSNTFSEYKSYIIIFNLTSPLFIIYNNLYNFHYLEWFFNLNLKDYF